LLDTLDKYRAQGSMMDTSYEAWYELNLPGREAHIETSICIEKARIIAYAGDFVSQMKGSMDDVFTSLAKQDKVQVQVQNQPQQLKDVFALPEFSMKPAPGNILKV
jgi:hypothetical protein